MKGILVGIIIALLLTPISVMIIGEVPYLDEGDGKSICGEFVDKIAPVSSLIATPSIFIVPENVYYLPIITLVWNGTDNPSGSGLQYFDVQYKMKYIGEGCHTMEIPYWRDWQMNTTNTSAEFWPAMDYIYFFRVRAIDYTGNTEPWPPVWDSFSVVIELPTIFCEIIHDRLEHRAEDAEEIIEKLREPIIPYKPPHGDLEPCSQVKPLFPIHFWFEGICYPQGFDFMTIQVVPYPPSYYLLTWLEEKGIISTNSYYASFDVSWVGYDDSDEGIKCYDVQSRNLKLDWLHITNDYPNGKVPYLSRDWKDWQTNISENNSVFRVGESGLYQFRCRAYDYNDNMESYPVSADTNIYVLDLRITDTY